MGYVMSIFANFIYLFAIVIVSDAYPFRKAFYNSYLFIFNIAAIWTLNVLICFYDRSLIWD